MLYNFMNIFGGAVKKITIPAIQRDYAQGRRNLKVTRIRQKFLDALYDAVNGDKIKLDFVYGDLKDGTLTPLDGQQRLTTLFLLYWYASKKENVAAEFLQNFSYETRPDSRQFCEKLITFAPNFAQKNLSAEIADQAWFPLSWKKDPTISAILTMIDAIHAKFRRVENLWQKLAQIEFYFLPVQDLGLADEIYITMNSRGKLLTDFEHFKAEFKRRLDEIDPARSQDIILKIDTTWTDMLWKIAVRERDFLVDNYFLNYFKFLCDLEIYRGNGIPAKDRDFFALLDEFFSGDVQAKLDELEENFKCWCECGDTYKFFSDRVIIGGKTDKIFKHAAGKFVCFFQMRTDGNFFADCLKSYDGKISKFLMLFAFLIFLRNKNSVDDSDFRRRIRVVNNLINNSESEIREQSMQALLAQVENIIKTGGFSDSLKINFNEFQMQEEKLKLDWTKKNPAHAESLFALEDHFLLYGQIGIIGVENAWNFESFIALFKCDYTLVDCALLASGDYFQHTSKNVYQLGSTNNLSWQNLFHANKNNLGYAETRWCLNNFLADNRNCDDACLERIIAEYLMNCATKNIFTWKYYYIRYGAFRPAYGKYFWADFELAPYLFTAYTTRDRISEKAYPPFLRALVREEIFAYRFMGVTEPKNNATASYLDFGRYKINCENAAYVVTDVKRGKVDRLKINQQNGVDTADRIAEFKNWAKQNIPGF